MRAYVQGDSSKKTTLVLPFAPEQLGSGGVTHEWKGLSMWQAPPRRQW